MRQLNILVYEEGEDYKSSAAHAADMIIELYPDQNIRKFSIIKNRVGQRAYKIGAMELSNRLLDLVEL